MCLITVEEEIALYAYWLHICVSSFVECPLSILILVCLCFLIDLLELWNKINVGRGC